MGKRSYASKSTTSEISRFSEVSLVITFWSSRNVCKTRPISPGAALSQFSGNDSDHCMREAFQRQVCLGCLPKNHVHYEYSHLLGPTQVGWDEGKTSFLRQV